MEESGIKIKDIEQEDIELSKKSKKFVAIVSLVLVLILVFFIVWIKMPHPIERETMTYNNFEFLKIAGLWRTTVQVGAQPYELILRYNPKEVENITIYGDEVVFEKTPIYITFNPEEDEENMKYLALAGAELSQSIARALQKDVKAACTTNTTDACKNQTIVKCGDEGESVIQISTKGPTRIVLRDSCILLQGEGINLLRSVDKLLYRYYHVLEQKKQ